jgi:recombination protein RecA
MASAAAIRLRIETSLAHRIPSALTPRPRVVRPVAPTGVAILDELLEGGLPLGAISEMTGPECSGRSAVALSFVSLLTRSGSVCAWVDVSDAFDPESAAAARVDLSRLLWVRCAVSPVGARVQSSTDYKFELPEEYFIPAPVKHGLHGGGCGGHPRNEVKGLAEAVSGLLHPKPIAPRCAELEPKARAERQPKDGPERETFLPTQQPRAPQTNLRTHPGKPWTRPWMRIEQALRVTDLLLQAGGFSAIVLDVAGIAAEYVSRVPMATWFRYRAAAERTQASVLLLTQYPCAKSSGELLLRFQPGEASNDEATVFTGLEHCVEIARQRFAALTNVVPLRKPPQREAYLRSRTTWASAR